MLKIIIFFFAIIGMWNFISVTIDYLVNKFKINNMKEELNTVVITHKL